MLNNPVGSWFVRMLVIANLPTQHPAGFAMSDTGSGDLHVWFALDLS
jgi:hypothetical protein